MNSHTIAALALVLAVQSFAREAQFAAAPYMDASLPAERRCDDLMARMTLAEKVAQLCTTSGFRMYEISPEGERSPDEGA